MLRIIDAEDHNRRVLRLEGRVAERWADELDRVTSAALGRSPLVVLDLSRVTFVDARGAATLRELAGRGAQLAGGSNFITALVEEDRP